MADTLPPIPSDLAVLSKTPVQVSVGLHDLLRRLRDDLASLRITTSTVGSPFSSFFWSGAGHMVDHASRRDAVVEISIRQIGGEMPHLHPIAPDDVGIVMGGPQLDRKRHPLAPPWRLGADQALEESLQAVDARNAEARRLLAATLDRMIALAAVAADPARRLPHGMIEPLRRRLLSAAASAYAEADPGLDLQNAVAYCAGPDAPMRVLAESPKLGIGFRDVLGDEARREWQTGFPPVMLLDGTTSRTLAFATPRFGWDYGEPIETMRAIGANRP